MPYLRITCSELDAQTRRSIAERLTDEVNDLFYNPRAKITRAELRDRTTVHFTPYGDEELFIGGRTPLERGARDITVELSDWNMSTRLRRRIARVLTPALAEAFGVPPTDLDGINLRFHAYRPSEFAVGGHLLSVMIPFVVQVLKRLAG